MKITTIVGARPQFVKEAALSHRLRQIATEILIHTGQHYDKKMSEIFFEEMNIPKPDYNLAVGSGTHAKQAADMMVGIETILLQEKPDAVLVYGDTNSTLAGALAAVKIHIPVIHVEAGLRAYDMHMPEEVNRVLTDRISKYLLCSTETAVENLAKEGIRDGVYLVGDIMCDAVLNYASMQSEIPNREFMKNLILKDGREISDIKTWYLATMHRPDNTDVISRLGEILAALNELDEKVIFPMHPRIVGAIKELEQTNNYDNIVWIEPVGYKEMIFLTKNAKKVITDSGGLQKEAYILNTPCITVRSQTEWVETLKGNHNILAIPDKQDILNKVQNTKINWSSHPDYYGRGNAADQICSVIFENFTIQY